MGQAGNTSRLITTGAERKTADLQIVKPRETNLGEKEGDHAEAGAGFRSFMCATWRRLQLTDHRGPRDNYGHRLAQPPR